MATTATTIRENNKLLTATTLAKFIQYKNAALPASRSPTKVQSPQTVCVFCSFRFVSLKLNKMRIAAKANAKRKLFFSQKPATTVKKLLSVFNVSLSFSVCEDERELQSGMWPCEGKVRGYQRKCSCSANQH